jgi:hypothetical protein
MGKAPTATALIATAGSPHALATSRTCALAIAIAVAAITAATDEYLRPTAGAQEQAARGLHRRSPWNAEENVEEKKIDGRA